MSAAISGGDAGQLARKPNLVIDEVNVMMEWTEYNSKDIQTVLRYLASYNKGEQALPCAACHIRLWLHDMARKRCGLSYYQ
jgi:tRNA U34 2-thiouridine synthase MnmA/TrmU